MVVYGIDVSYHNELIDWGRVRADGVTFATMKASNGLPSQTVESGSYFRTQAPAMAAAMPLCGGYHWLKPANYESQVDNFLRQMTAGLGGYRGRLVQLDVEEGSPADVRGWLAAWSTRTHGYPVALYLPDWLENQWPHNLLGSFGAAAWWSSEYVAGAGLPYRELSKRITATQWHTQDGVRPSVLQYTSRAVVAGVAGNADVNVFAGELDELAAQLTGVPTMALTDDDVERLANAVATLQPFGKFPNIGQAVAQTYNYLTGGGEIRVMIADVQRLLGELVSAPAPNLQLDEATLDALADKILARLLRGAAPAPV